jgi:replicative superfamily II helicase
MQDMFEIEETSQEATEGVNGVDARLIWDLVSNMRPAAEILKNYGLSPGDLAVKAQNELFTSAYREAQRLWKSDMNIQQRIRLKAAFLLEDSLPRLFQIVTSDNPVNAKLNAIEQLQKIAIVTNDPKKGDSMEKHNITINIGGAAPPINVVAEVPHGTTPFSG